MPRIILGGSVVPVGDRMWGPGGPSREGTGALPSGGSIRLLSTLSSRYPFGLLSARTQVSRCFFTKPIPNP